jgi:hypothetical protein
MRFSVWMEGREIYDAILGVVGSGAELSPDERSHLLSRNTKDFGPEIIKRLKNLGVVKKTNDGMGKYGTIVRKIDDGMTIHELIKEIEKD